MAKTFSVSIAFDKDSLAKLDALARADERSRSWMVRKLIKTASEVRDPKSAMEASGHE